MSAPEARLAVATASAWADAGSSLIAGFGDPAVAEATGGPVTAFEQDLRAYRSIAPAESRGIGFGAFLGKGFPLLEAQGPVATGGFAAAVLQLPKATEHLRMLLTMTRPMLADDACLVLVGHNDAGIRSADRHLRGLIGEGSVIDYRYHCRALLARPTVPPSPFDPRAWLSTLREQPAGRPLIVCSYPGVFSHGEIDPGTRLLLETVRLPPDARVLDVGCGAGVIAAWVAAVVEEKVHAVDVSALALHATFLTAEANDVGDRVLVWGSDLFSDVSERYTHVLSNAPFHAGIKTSSGVAQRLIAEAPGFLRRGGELWLVANRFLDHGEQLARAFDHVTVEAEDRRFRVWRAR